MRVSVDWAPWLGLLLLPAAVARSQVGVPAALAATLLLVAARWGLTLRRILAGPEGADLRLESIPPSHFVEKVRWCLDRLGVPYHEVPDMGVLGVLLTGRTVPRLSMRTGRVRSSIGNSAEILRYLWGRYRVEYGPRAAFLEPTPEALTLEAELDRYGQHLQMWGYHHLLDRPDLCLHFWGAEDPRVPGWQKWAARCLYPVTRRFMRHAFQLHPDRHAGVVARLEEVLERCEARLEAHPASLLGGPEVCFVDLTLAALSGLWVRPPGFGAGSADHVMVDEDALPAAMVGEIAGWRRRFPRLVEHVERLYRDRV